MLQCVCLSRNVPAHVPQSSKVTGLRSDGTKHKHSVILPIHHSFSRHTHLGTEEKEAEKKEKF